VPLGKMLLFCCIMVSLMTALPAVAQDENECTGAEMIMQNTSYAKLVFCLPPEVVVDPEPISGANYTSGTEVAASMLLDGDRVGLHLLYPCQAPQKELEAAELKAYLEAYNPILTQATYNESVPGPALWGQIANQIFIAYQPNNQTVALILMDINMSETMMTTFLDNLRIAVNEGVTPPSNCPDTTDTTVAPAEATSLNNPATSQTTDATTTTEAIEDKLATAKEKKFTDFTSLNKDFKAKMAEMRSF
jgi:hypothetical protein